MNVQKLNFPFCSNNVMINVNTERVGLVDWLVVFYSTSILISYLMPNPVSTYLSNIYNL